LDSVFNAAFGLIDNEKFEEFEFLIHDVQELLNRQNIRTPDVVITDGDKQMKAALDVHFPDTQQQLLIHHINSNVSANARKLWPRPDSSDDEPANNITIPETNTPGLKPIPHTAEGVHQLWKRIVFAETEEEHEQAWENLRKESNDQPAIISYLLKEYMLIRKQWARYFIKRYRNFSMQVTSGTEAVRGQGPWLALKSFGHRRPVAWNGDALWRHYILKHSQCSRIRSISLHPQTLAIALVLEVSPTNDYIKPLGLDSQIALLLSLWSNSLD
jgi:hypothetical protein